MFARNFSFCLLACVAVLGTTSFAAAGDRESWNFDGGSFVKLKGKQWVERSATSTEKFRFVEAQRTNEFVELYDKSRDCTIRLRNRHCMFRASADAKFEKLYEGGWADK